MMKAREFKEILDKLAATNSRKEKKQLIRDIYGDGVRADSDEMAAISFLSGSEFDDVGLGKKTVLSVAQDVFGDHIDGQPTVSESVEGESALADDEYYLSELRTDMNALNDSSGNEQQELLAEMFEHCSYPSVVAHACLNDLPTGVSDTTIANALDLRDSLPFYESVVHAAEAVNPHTEPMIHSSFDPMLAKSESNLPDDLSDYVAQPKLDGYRLIIHIGEKRVTAFTRRGNDVSASLPELNEIHWPDGEWIVDCEVIAETGSYADTSERIGRDAENVERDVDMEFGIFDVLTHDDQTIYERPFKERYGWTVTFSDLTRDERVGALPIFTDEGKAKNVSSDYEGLIWKDMGAEYEFGKRSKAWVKEKHTSETVDLVATEFVEGEGRLDGTLGKIGLETADGTDVGYTGSGFTDEQRDKIWTNQDEFLGEPLEVEAEAFDDGLRFPIFQRWRSEDGEPDTLKRVESVMPEP